MCYHSDVQSPQEVSALHPGQEGQTLLCFLSIAVLGTNGSYWIHDQVQEDSFVDLACEVDVIRLNNAADLGDRRASQQEGGADMEVAVMLSEAGSYRKL